MTDTEQPESFDDELLSAYVDGELDPQQSAFVEQRLRDDPGARQLVAELQELSASLRALPREQIGKSLRDAVLLRTEQEPVTLSSKPPRTSFARRWTWAALAVAATFFLIVFQPQAIQEDSELAEAEPQAGRAGSAAPMPSVASTEEAAAPMEEALAADDRALAAESERFVIADEAADALCFVHLTYADKESGPQKFNEQLMVNGIDMEDKSPAFAASAPPPGALAGKAAPPAETPAVVLVEASPTQIEGLLEDFNADTRNWYAVSFADQTDAQLPEPRWRGFERSNQATDVPKAPSAVRETLDAEHALSSRASGSTDASEKQLKAQVQKNYTLRGRAMRYDADWRQLQGQQTTANKLSVQSRAKLKQDLAGVGREQEEEKVAAAQVKVFFVLHPAESVEPSTED
ncbi:MAG: hypothetical protein KDA57_00420 [Planctomycetales bacterium]|nr:hypothetical protein [Planctomycetales bacterium]